MIYWFVEVSLKTQFEEGTGEVVKRLVEILSKRNLGNRRGEMIRQLIEEGSKGEGSEGGREVIHITVEEGSQGESMQGGKRRREVVISVANKLDGLDVEMREVEGRLDNDVQWLKGCNRFLERNTIKH